MSDQLSSTLKGILKKATADGIQVFRGYIAEADSASVADWDRESGGDWKEFIACARAFGANILYVDKTVFEQSQIDDAVSALGEAFSEESHGDAETRDLISGIREFQKNVGLVCAIDLAFVANGVVHKFQETTTWFDAFDDLTDGDEDDGEVERNRSIDRTLVSKWATTLASDPKYPTAKNREYLLEKLSGDLFSTLPIHEVLRRAETVFDAEFKTAADELLAAEIQNLRGQGLNIDAIALQLGTSRGRVSGLVSLITNRKKTS